MSSGHLTPLLPHRPPIPQSPGVGGRRTSTGPLSCPSSSSLFGHGYVFRIASMTSHEARTSQHPSLAHPSSSSGSHTCSWCTRNGTTDPVTCVYRYLTRLPGFPHIMSGFLSEAGDLFSREHKQPLSFAISPPGPFPAKFPVSPSLRSPTPSSSQMHVV